MERIESLGIEDYKIIQDTSLYKFTSDAILLSKFAEGKVNDKVADFCSGSGIVGLHFYLLNRKTTKLVHMYEIQEELATMSKKSIELNNLIDTIEVFNIPIQNIDNDKNGLYSLILCNPPYKKVNSGEKCEKDHITICRHEVTVTLEEIIKVASRKLKFSGRLCICQKIERFIDSIELFKQYGLNPSRVQFVTSNSKNEPYLFMLEGYKGTNPQFKVCPNIINGED